MLIGLPFPMAMEKREKKHCNGRTGRKENRVQDVSCNVQTVFHTSLRYRIPHRRPLL